MINSLQIRCELRWRYFWSLELDLKGNLGIKEYLEMNFQFSNVYCVFTLQ